MSLLESRFTPANDFCPHPEHWESPDAEATEYEVSALVGALVRAIQPEFVLETGSYKGHTTFEIGNALKANGHGAAVSIENNPNHFTMAQSSVWGLPVTVLNINSMDYVPEQDIDFAFFDSWQEGRMQEFMRYWEMGRLKAGAIVSFHDTAPHHQVWEGVNLLEKRGFIKTITIHSPRGFTMAQVLK